VSASASLSDEEIDNLIFMPGFSTANQVSNISGRGVGMDVVRRNILDLGGRVTISSLPQQGSRFSLTLPLTLAVLDGMIVSVGDQTFVLPLAHIVESLKPKREDIRAFGADRSLLRIRNTYVPLVRIGELLVVNGAKTDPVDGVVILVESEGTGQLALAVDGIVGQQQVVIKSFESNYHHIEGIAAATILGDGRVALILDVDGLVTRCRDAQQPADRFEALQAAAGA
jgi:two-component system chemotaxis sensor kinase CheA